MRTLKLPLVFASSGKAVKGGGEYVSAPTALYNSTRQPPCGRRAVSRQIAPLCASVIKETVCSDK